jgi:processive 1,2-diacylglycerol beta-glucosyltransferase
MGRALVAVQQDGFRVMTRRLPALVELQYRAVATWRPGRAAGQAALERIARRGLLALIAQHRPDVVVSTYPGTTEVLGRLRRGGALAVPVVSAISDLSALRYWAHPGIDLHLVTHPESIAEVRDIAGPDARVRPVTGMTAPEFLTERDPAAARAALGLPAAGAIVAISGGGWGVGDVGGAAACALALAGVSTVLCLCGRNEELRRALAARFAGEPRGHALGFTERMGDVLAAADALVHTSAGLTVLEALLRGCRPISYGWGVGHVRLNNVAYRRFGLAEVVSTPAGLSGALSRALAAPRRPARELAALPPAAPLILALARGA